MRKINLIVLLSALVVFHANSIVVNASAEEPARGILPDGRAYRTDESGNQLVDYIAELEVEVESLKRRVTGLEDENSEKQALIESFKRTGSTEPEITERDLNVKPKLPVECKPTVVEKIVERVVEKPVDRVVERPIEKIVEKPSPCLPASDNSQYVEEIKSLKEDLNKSQIALSKKDDLLEQREMDIATLNTKLQAQSKIASLNVPQSQPLQKGLFKGGTPKPPPADTRIKAVDMLRKNMLQDLRSFDDLVSYRNKLYARIDHSRFPEPENVDVNAFRSRLQSAEQVHDLSRARTEINEQRGKVQKEIALYKRELKIR